MPDPKLPHDPLRKLGGTRRAYVIPERRVLFISVGKNACTSIKWMLAGLAGEDPEDLRPRLGFYPNRDAGVHSRYSWKKTPRLTDIPREMRRGISPENGWMVFAVVRDPRSRLFSAWESKYLLRNPAYVRRMDRSWAPRVPEGPQDVIDDFAKFVFALEADPDHEVFQGDTHFRAQTFVLAEDVVPYSRIYDISQLGTLVSDLTAHVRANGYTGPDLELASFNDTPLTANREVFAGGVREAIEKIYAADFDRFGDWWDFSALERREMTWTRDSIAHVQSLIKAHERIADLAREAKKLKQRNEQLAERNQKLRERNKRLREQVRPSRPGRLSQRVLRRLRRS